MTTGPRTRYHIEVACSVRLRNVLVAGLFSCLTLAGFLGYAVVEPVIAQSSRWMDTAEARIARGAAEVNDLKVAMAEMHGAYRLMAADMANVKAQIAAVQSTQWQTMVAILGLLVTAVLGLIGVLWNLRSGWLTVKADD